MLKNLSIKQMIVSVGIIIFLSVSINMLLSYESADDVRESVYEKDNEITPHLMNFLRLQKDVIQVQQWLTDISATRAKPGFDDGFGEAKKYFEDGNKALDELITAHTQYGETEMVEGLNNFKDNFSKFYQVGIKMANAYIAGGPDSGNKVMGELDPFAEKLTKDLEAWVQEHKDDSESAKKNIEDKLDSLEQQTLIYGLFLIILTTTIFILMISRIMSSLTNFQVGLLEFFKFLNNETETAKKLE